MREPKDQMLGTIVPLMKLSVNSMKRDFGDLNGLTLPVMFSFSFLENILYIVWNENHHFDIHLSFQTV